MFDVISPFINLLWPFAVAIGGLLGLFFYGRRKKAEGRREEQRRSEKVVREVQDEMQAEIDKPRTSEKTRKRLDDGSF